MKNKKGILSALLSIGFIFLSIGFFTYAEPSFGAECVLGQPCTDGLGKAGTCKLGPDATQRICVANESYQPLGTACTTDTGKPGKIKLDQDGVKQICEVDSWTGTPSETGKTPCTKVGEPCINWADNRGICNTSSSGTGLACEVVAWNDSNASTTKSWWDSLWPSDSQIKPNGAASAQLQKCQPGFADIGGVCFPDKAMTGLSDAGVLDLLANLLSWLFALFSILAIMAFVISGIQYLVSAGDSSMIEVAKRNMTWSVVGIVVGLSGYMILKAVMAALSGSPIF